MKKASSRYFGLLRMQSSHLGKRIFLLKREKPFFQSSSSIVPTGQIQEQKERLRRRETSTAEIRVTTAAGWIGFKLPVKSHSFIPRRAAMGRNASMPSGLSVSGEMPPVRKPATNW